MAAEEGVAVVDGFYSVALKRLLHPLFNLVPDAPVASQNFNLSSLECGWVGKAPVDILFAAREERAGFSGVVTNRYHGVDLPAEELVYALGAVSRQVDADFFHHLSGFGPDDGGPGARAEYLETVAVKVP